MFGIKMKTPHVVRVSNVYAESGVIWMAYIGSDVGGWTTSAKNIDILWLHQTSMIYVHKVNYSKLSPYLPTVNPKFNIMWHLQVERHLILVSSVTRLVTVLVTRLVTALHVRWPQSSVNITNNQESCTMEGFHVLKQGEQQHTIITVAVLCTNLYVTSMW